MTKISIALPVYNEVENLRPLLEKIEESVLQMNVEAYEVIFVNDGSTDGSEALINELARQNPNVVARHFKSNQGQTAALDAGIRSARYDYVFTLDSDLQNDPADMGKLLEKMVPGVGAVCGIRVKRQDSWLKLMSSRIANWVRNKLSGEEIVDTGCGLKLFRREAFRNIKLFEGMHRFFPTLIKMEGFRVLEVPVSHHPRVAGTSKYGVLNRVFKSFKDLMAVRWMKTRLLRYEFKDIED